MSKWLILFVAFVMINGCTNPLHLRHDFKKNESQEYFSDRTVCKSYANSSAPVTYSTNTTSDGETTLNSGRNKETWTMTYYECMRGKGWFSVNEVGNRIDYEWCSQVICL